MPKQPSPQPRPVLQVMVSSSFTDLQEHRTALIEALLRYGLHPNAMEHDSAKPAVDVIASSLQMVRDSHAYTGVISLKYGQIPKCPDRNADELSLTELEYNEALSLERPILLFIMGEDHSMKKSDIERDPVKEAKLDAFRERAKLMASGVKRVYAEFNSLKEFEKEIGPALAKLSRHLELPPPEVPVPATAEPIPQPPAFYAEPDYIGSHKFVGRHSQLQDLSDWAQPADPTNLLLFEAIGGNGKSMLTWEWTTKHAAQVRPDWAGRFWYSFYERGAIMADFCRRALAYMTGVPLRKLRKKKITELKEELLARLHARPWLLILDGLERVLVAYHRIDAAEVPDEEANAPSDKIVHRNPCDAIRDEDNDLLRAFAAATPSKILVSSRLTPRVLLNPSGQPITGVKRITLPGLRPPDAEKLLRSCGITGDSAAIQSYLTTNCDNHPLVIGVLAGLINDYLPDRGNFDAWSVDPGGGGQLNLASLDLIQRRNHILRAALAALPQESAQLLSTLALLSESVDYETLKAFNPHRPPELKNLAETVRDLERRGLLQYDGRLKHYDLHPVVRGVAAGGLRSEEKERYGQRVVDHFSIQPHNPYEQAETLEDLRSGLNVVRTLLKLGHFQKAASVYRGDLARALSVNLDAHAETLSLLRPFFPAGWGELPKGLSGLNAAYLANEAALALLRCGELRDSLAAYGTSLRYDLEPENWLDLSIILGNISGNLTNQNLLAKAFRLDTFALAVTTLIKSKEGLFAGRLNLFADQSRIGQWGKAEATWQLLEPMGRRWPRHLYRPGYAEHLYALFQFWQGSLQEKHLAVAEHLAAEGKNRGIIFSLHWLRGAWRLEQGEWALAIENLHEAVRLARERSLPDAASETGLALAKFHLGQLAEPRLEAERLAQARYLANRLLALLWLAIGDQAQAQKHALAAFQWAWADGEPYVHRYELTKTTELLRQLDVPIPTLPPYDPAKDEKLPWEDAVAAAIEKLRTEKEAHRGYNIYNASL